MGVSLLSSLTTRTVGWPSLETSLSGRFVFRSYMVLACTKRISLDKSLPQVRTRLFALHGCSQQFVYPHFFKLFQRGRRGGRGCRGYLSIRISHKLYICTDVQSALMLLGTVTHRKDWGRCRIAELQIVLRTPYKLQLQQRTGCSTFSAFVMFKFRSVLC